MNNVWVFPYKAGSNGARDLARELGVRRISHSNSRFRGNDTKTVINWGASRLPEEVGKCNIINPADRVGRASNKLRFFETISEADQFCRIPQFSTDIHEVINDMRANGNTWFGRTVLNGHSGDGIVPITIDNYMQVHDDTPLTRIPLFVKYVKKRQEYRVHVLRGQVLDIQRKARDRSVPDEAVNWQVRNHSNGFIFARDGEALGDVPADVMDQAVAAVNICGLDFGAVDVVFNDNEQAAYVIEVNTSPGLTGTTLDNYAQGFRNLLGA